MQRRSFRGLLLASLCLSAAACHWAPLSSVAYLGRPGPEVIELQPGESVNVDFFAANANNPSGVQLMIGSRYALQIATLSTWINGEIDTNEAGEPIDQTGYADSVMQWQDLATARRSRAHRWFELMLYQPQCASDSLSGVSDLEQDPQSGRYVFTAACSGTLNFYANDSLGLYLDNKGFANLILSRID